MVVINLGRLGYRLGSVVADTGYDIAEGAVRALLNSGQQLDNLLERAIEKLEPVTVPMHCTPNGPAPNDYYLDVSVDALEAALSADRWVRPQIIIFAGVHQDKIDEAVFAERALRSLEPLFERLETHIEQIKHRKETKKREQKEANEGFLIEFLAGVLEFMLLGAGTFLGPILWLGLGLAGVVVLKEVPGLLVDALKEYLLGRKAKDADEQEIEALEAKRAKYQPLVAKMVTHAKYVVTDDLKALHESFQ